MLTRCIYRRLHLPVNARGQNMFSRDVKRLCFRRKTSKFSRPNDEVGVLVVHSVLLTVHCQRGQELIWRAEKVLKTDFLREVDEDLLIYAGELRSNGFTSAASAKYLTENDLAGIPEGHKRLILNMVSRLRTPLRERPQAKFPSSSKKSPASESPARKKNSP